MTHGTSEWTAEFYPRARGDSPPRDYIRRLGKPDRAKIAQYIKLLEQTGVRLGMPYVEHLEGPIWQLRPKPYRLLYFAHTGRRFIILVAFRKKTGKTPQQKIDLAFRRMNDMIGRGS